MWVVQFFMVEIIKKKMGIKGLYNVWEFRLDKLKIIETKYSIFFVYNVFVMNKFSNMKLLFQLEYSCIFIYSLVKIYYYIYLKIISHLYNCHWCFRERKSLLWLLLFHSPYGLISSRIESNRIRRFNIPVSFRIDDLTMSISLVPQNKRY